VSDAAFEQLKGPNLTDAVKRFDLNMSVRLEQAIAGGSVASASEYYNGAHFRVTYADDETLWLDSANEKLLDGARTIHWEHPEAQVADLFNSEDFDPQLWIPALERALELLKNPPAWLEAALLERQSEAEHEDEEDDLEPDGEDETPIQDESHLETDDDLDWDGGE
jgi:hypothetical protein